MRALTACRTVSTARSIGIATFSCVTAAARFGRAPHEDSLFHSLARLVLEPRQRTFLARRVARTDPLRAHGRGFRAQRKLEPCTALARPWPSRAYRLTSTPIPNCPPPNTREDVDLGALVDDCDLVIVHEWNEPWLVDGLGRLRRSGARFTLLFHDTHHRAVSDPEGIRSYRIGDYDGVLAFGEALAEVYRRWGWSHVFVWHEAADTRLFQAASRRQRRAMVWSGSETGATKSARARLKIISCGPRRGRLAARHLRRSLSRAWPCRRWKVTALDFRGWLPNARAPEIFRQPSRHCACAAAASM